MSEHEKPIYRMSLEAPGHSITIECNNHEDAEKEFYRTLASFLSPYGGLIGRYFRRVEEEPHGDDDE